MEKPLHIQGPFIFFLHIQGQKMYFNKTPAPPPPHPRYQMVDAYTVMHLLMFCTRGGTWGRGEDFDKILHPQGGEFDEAVALRVGIFYLDEARCTLYNK